MTSYPDDIQISLTLYSCWFKDCVPPPPEDEMEPAVERDGNFTYWDEILWEQDPDNDQGFISSLPEGRYHVTDKTDKFSHKFEILSYCTICLRATNP